MKNHLLGVVLIIAVSRLATIKAAAQQPPQSVAPRPAISQQQTNKLLGIVQWKGKKYAAMELQGRRYSLTAEGSRDTSYEVMNIDEKAGSVRLRNLQEEQILHLVQRPNEQDVQCTLNLENVPTPLLLEVYQVISDRTVLAPSTLPITLEKIMTAPALPADDTVKFLDEILAKEGLAAIPCSDKFVFVVPKDKVQSVMSIAEPPPSVNQPAPDGEVFPAGLIRFQDADILQALDLYQELSGRTVLSAGNLTPSKITFRTQTALTRAQALWAFDAMLFLGDCKMVKEGKKFVYAVPVNAKVGLPQFDAKAIAAKIGKGANPDEVFPPAVIRLQDAELQNVLTLYATVIGRKPVLPKAPLPLCRFNLRMQTEMTHTECLFALEAIAALNGIKFQMIEDDGVTPSNLASTP
jgi:hypothetical protein